MAFLSASKWRTTRKILTPAFHFKILESYIDIMNINSKIMLELLDKEVGKEKFDIGPYIDKCTLDIICGKFSNFNIFSTFFSLVNLFVHYHV